MTRSLFTHLFQTSIRHETHVNIFSKNSWDANGLQKAHWRISCLYTQFCSTRMCRKNNLESRASKMVCILSVQCPGFLSLLRYIGNFTTKIRSCNQYFGNHTNMQKINFCSRAPTVTYAQYPG